MKKPSKLFACLAVVGLVTAPTVSIADGVSKSESPPFWTFAAPPPVGETKLFRSQDGLSAIFRTTGLTVGNVVTLWIMFFDNPEACTVPGACNPDDDIGRPGVRFDFHYGGARLVHGHRTVVIGYLPVGEVSTSGWAELAAIGGAPPSFVTPLTNPNGAQVILALHDHGPRQEGGAYKAQLSSYLGGCVLPFLGDAAGFAQSPADLPANEGECSTIQVSFHNP